MRDDKPVDRRRFFREGLRELLRPLASAIEPIENVARQLGNLEPEPSKALSLPPPRADGGFGPVLRPPGALDELAFRDTCARSGQCVEACPVKAIRLDPAGREGGGAPWIDAGTQACVLCDGLYCMEACPSGALVRTPLPDIDIGTARWNEPTCLRTTDEDCRICIQKCPMGLAAIELRDNKVHVIEDGCTGCGVCQQLCPTSPKSIVVIPKALRM